MHRDFVSIATPEGLTLDLELAGPGSRSAAALIDHTIIVLLLFGTFALMDGVGSGFGAIALAGVIAFGVLFGYFIVFEMFWRGQSPGKWLMHLRVLHDDGAAAGWRASILRNLVRIVDFLPSFYVIGLLALIGSSRDQRLGDLAAGTVVVRQLRFKAGGPAITFDMPRQEGWDITAVTTEEIAVVRHFLLRRHDLPPSVRDDIGFKLFARLSGRVVRPDASVPVELFLEAVAGARATSA